MDKLIIDPEFRDKIPPLTEEEFTLLEENILTDGAVFSPLIVWDNTILDGHNRIRLIRERWVIKRAEQYGTYFSLIPYTEEVYGVTLKGAKYPLRDYHFTVFGTGSLGVSNEITEEQVEISIKKGILILIESKD